MYFSTLFIRNTKNCTLVTIALEHNQNVDRKKLCKPTVYWKTFKTPVILVFNVLQSVWL